MKDRIRPAMDAAYAGDVVAFRTALAADPELVTERNAPKAPCLFQWVVVEGGLHKVPEPLRFVKILVDGGAPLDEPLVAAASVAAEDIVMAILDAGAAIDGAAPWTALEETLYWAHGELGAELVAAHGAQVGSLRAAAELGDEAKTLAFFGVDGSLLDGAGPVRFPFGEVSAREQDVLDQAFLLALKNDQFGTAGLILDRGADVNGIPPGNHEECTPLHQAVYMQRSDMVAWLLARGAVADIEDPRFSATAVGWARHFGHEDIAQQIERHG